jgi:hypothetical protein
MEQSIEMADVRDHLRCEVQRVARSKRCRVAICAHEAAALTE